ncbi:MAG: head GIN domain-containing protein [Cruoricaptor ignavus]|nr:head GIN domain-containing protein [Cruoricaptor ignavus]
MKTIIFSSAIALYLFSCTAKESNQNLDFSFYSTEKSLSNTTQKEYRFDFDAIKVSTSINAEVVKSDTEKVVIYAPENIIDDVLVENKNGTLHIRFKPGFSIKNWKNVKAKIFAKNFSEIEASSSADIILKDKFVQEKMSVKTSSSGSISGDLEANQLSIKASSSGDFSGNIWAINLSAATSSSAAIRLKGKAKNASLSASSSGDIKARELRVENATLSASSSGDIVVSVSENAVANASSSSDILIYKIGNPSISKSTGSSGTVTVK